MMFFIKKISFTILSFLVTNPNWIHSDASFVSAHMDRQFQKRTCCQLEIDMNMKLWRMSFIEALKNC